MQSNLRRYYFFLFLELLVVLGVMGIFRVILDRPTGGALAGGLFLVSTLVILIWEWVAMRRLTWALIGALVFFLGGVVPILLLRWLSWGDDFEKANLLGVTGGFLHRTSNLFFLILLVGIFLSLQQARRRLESSRAAGN